LNDRSKKLYLGSLFGYTTLVFALCYNGDLANTTLKSLIFLLFFNTLSFPTRTKPKKKDYILVVVFAIIHSSLIEYLKMSPQNELWMTNSILFFLNLWHTYDYLRLKNHKK